MNRQEVIRELQERYRQCGPSLDERQRRHWAATEAMKLARGGITIVSEALRMSPNTIKKGIQELVAGQADTDSDANGRIRKSGGGRKSREASSDRPNRSRPTIDSAETQSQPRTVDALFQQLRDASPLRTGLDSAAGDDNA